ncbi:ORF5a [RtClon arterivirus]|uniref:ORF5a n=1 Tax=RtClon arterivirus TaxID=2847272 RepID=A0A1L6Z3N7_9NIDO|nr:ORF5a [Rat arterivirus 1]APT40625.1 ORF5a [RtClon arterivirus]
MFEEAGRAADACLLLVLAFFLVYRVVLSRNCCRKRQQQLDFTIDL